MNLPLSEYQMFGLLPVSTAITDQKELLGSQKWHQISNTAS